MWLFPQPKFNLKPMAWFQFLSISIWNSKLDFEPPSLLSRNVTDLTRSVKDRYAFSGSVMLNQALLQGNKKGRRKGDTCNVLYRTTGGSIDITLREFVTSLRVSITNPTHLRPGTHFQWPHSVPSHFLNTNVVKNGVDYLPESGWSHGCLTPKAKVLATNLG